MSRPTVHLHIGAMKTGTTFLQRLLVGNIDRLDEAGVLFPGRTKWWLQVAAVRDRMGRMAPSGGDVTGTWDRMVGEIHAHGGPSLVSMEFLSFADEATARHIVAGLGDVDVSVVLTVRDARGVTPSMWQTATRAGKVIPWSKFARQLVEQGPDPDSVAWLRFERTQGVPRMLDAWCGAVGADRVHVVVVPSSGSAPDLLWRRFAPVVGLDPAGYALPERQNESLGHPSAELMRLVYERLGDRARGTTRQVVRRVLGDALLAGRRDAERPVALTRPLRDFGARWNGTVRDAITAAGVHVVGGLEELPTEPGDGDLPEEPVEPSTREVLDAAEYAVAHYRNILRSHLEREGGHPLAEAFLAGVHHRDAWRAADRARRAAAASVAEAVEAHAAFDPFQE